MVKTKLHYKGFDLFVKSMPVKVYDLVNPRFRELNPEIEDGHIFNMMHITNHYCDRVEVSEGIIYKPCKDCKNKNYISAQYCFLTDKYPTKKDIKKIFDEIEEDVYKVNDDGTWAEEADE